MVPLLTLTGCDFFRTLAGRPTSKDIENKQIAVLLAENKDIKAKYDAVRAELCAVKDSLNALDSISQLGGSVLNPTTLGGLYSTKLEARYYVIVGAYKYRTNAEIFLKKVQKAGYKPALINFRNGKMAVGVCPSNNIKDVLSSLKKVKKETFCPSDVWILRNE